MYVFTKGNPAQSKFTIYRAVPQKKKRKPKTVFEIHDRWFFDLEPKHFVALQKAWNEKKLAIKLPNLEDYDEWLNYFKNLSPNMIKMLAMTGQDILSTEAYAALSRWHDIISSPHRIEKIHQSGLTKPKKGKDDNSITALALKNDRYGVLCATRDAIAEKLQKGAGARDTAALARELTEVMTQISDYEKRLGPKKDTVLGGLLDDMPMSRKRNRESGARNTSFKSRVTIEDVKI